MNRAASTSLPVRRLTFDPSERRPPSRLEWIVTNGLGGYASGTVAGELTRRYHGLLIASLPAPLGRTLYLSQLRSAITQKGRQVTIDHESSGRLHESDVAPLVAFELHGGLPVWRYQLGSGALEKRVVMAHRENTTVVTYTLVGTSRETHLRLWPLLQVRPHEGQVSLVRPEGVQLESTSDGLSLKFPAPLPAMQWRLTAADSRSDFSMPDDVSLQYAIERERGYAHDGALWYPGWLDVTLEADRPVGFIISTEPRERVHAIDTDALVASEVARREGLLRGLPTPPDTVAAELTIAADQFVVVPVGRFREVMRERALGEDPRTIIAGYHWFTDWGRDTMIGLEGLVLCTGRHAEAEDILRNFAHHVRDGLIPNLFPEGEQEGLYHTADATLWFFHALDRYVTHTGDHALVADLLPTLADIVDHHLAGTRFGIHVDEADGLLAQGADHYQLTWMDAKVGDWVVTPRRGKTVEINALWYNALCLMEAWQMRAGQLQAAEKCRKAATRAQASFNLRFWNETTGHLYDLVDGERGNDPACRPNQVLSMSLTHPVLDSSRWKDVVDVVERILLTPVGLRSLAPGHPDYASKYFGDLRTRDAAYHQGTVWAWLIGPFIDAWLRVHPGEHARARVFLSGLVAHLDDAGVGTVSEIFDADAPFTPRGCIAQAWSVAEMLRTWLRTEKVVG